MMQVCLIGKSWTMCSVGVPPGTGLGNTCLKTEAELKNMDRKFNLCIYV